MQPNFKSVVEDSLRNKYFLYYSDTSVCCKEVSKDGISRDTIIASNVIDNFLVAIDLQDKIYVACQNKEKRVFLFVNTKGEWKLEHTLNIQGSGNIKLLSLFGINRTLNIVYAKEMTIANFYNIYHLYKSDNSDSNYASNTWKKNNICEMYAEDISSSYSSIMTKEGALYVVCEGFDGSNYLINYCWFDNSDESWKKKVVATLFKKDIILNILYEDSLLHLLCYTYEDEASAIFYYVKKEGGDKDFEFCCVDKINTEMKVSPYFHIEGSIIYLSWILDNSFYQYALNKEQKLWNKKLSSIIPANEIIRLIEYFRNRKGKYWIIKKTYFTIDYKYNINLPYFKDRIKNNINNSISTEKPLVKNTDGDMISYIPHLIDEVRSMSQMIKNISDKLDQIESENISTDYIKTTNNTNKTTQVSQHETSDINKLKKSNFKDHFMKSNKLLNRPEATSIFVGSANIPNPDELSKKEGIDFVENSNPKTEPVQKESEIKATTIEDNKISETETEADASVAKDNNLFKKIGEFFK